MDCYDLYRATITIYDRNHTTIYIYRTNIAVFTKQPSFIPLDDWKLVAFVNDLVDDDGAPVITFQIHRGC